MNSINYNIYSDARSKIMGLSIIWIMFFHLFFGNMQGWFLDIGYGGVDFFLFYSAYGLYFSYSKNPNLKEFWRRRFMRIIPTYFIAVIFYYYLILQSVDFLHMLLLLSTVGFWIGRQCEWYISAIIVFYLFFPFVFKLFKRYGVIVLLSIAFLGVLLSFIIGYCKPYSVIFFTSRIPVFLMGIWFADRTKRSLAIKYPIYMFIAAAIGWICMYLSITHLNDLQLLSTSMYFLPFIMIVPGTALLLSLVFRFCEHIKILSLLNMLLSLCGTYSLELFLAHGKLLKILDPLETTGISYTFQVIIWVIGSIVVAYLLNRVTSFIINKRSLS